MKKESKESDLTHTEDKSWASHFKSYSIHVNTTQWVFIQWESKQNQSVRRRSLSKREFQISGYPLSD